MIFSTFLYSLLLLVLGKTGQEIRSLVARIFRISKRNKLVFTLMSTSLVGILLETRFNDILKINYM